jgi:hypothetical protein
MGFSHYHSRIRDKFLPFAHRTAGNSFFKNAQSFLAVAKSTPGRLLP